MFNPGVTLLANKANKRDSAASPAAVPPKSCHRPKSFARDQFTLDPLITTHSRCNHCPNHIMSHSNVSTMADHLRRCSDFLSSSQAQTCKDPEVVRILLERALLKQRTPGADPMPVIKPPAGGQASISHFTDRISVAHSESIDDSLGDMFFQCGLPHTLVEHPLFKKFCHRLKPTYKVPGRTKLSTAMLDKKHAALQAELLAQLASASSVTLTTDSWCKSQVGACLRCQLFSHQR